MPNNNSSSEFEWTDWQGNTCICTINYTTSNSYGDSPAYCVPQWDNIYIPEETKSIKEKVIKPYGIVAFLEKLNAK